MPMKVKHASEDTELLVKLRQEEAQLTSSPSTDRYVRLADAYRGLGMGRQADRMLQMAEVLESGGTLPPQVPHAPQPSPALHAPQPAPLQAPQVSPAPQAPQVFPAPQTDGFLSGAATPTMLVEVIQILTRTKVSGEFLIDAQSQTFHLFFDHGHIINACSKQYSPGIDSFSNALRVPHGSYRFVQKPVREVARLIDERPDVLLLNAMQELDEQIPEPTT
jgi:hypothetical protein